MSLLSKILFVNVPFLWLFSSLLDHLFFEDNVDDFTSLSRAPIRSMGFLGCDLPCFFPVVPLSFLLPAGDRLDRKI